MANNQVADTQTQQNITDDEWVARAGTQEGPNPTPANLQMQSPMTDEEWVAKQAHENQTPGVVTPVTPIGTEMPKNSEPVPKTLQGHLSATVKPFYDFVADEFGIGMTGVHEGEEGDPGGTPDRDHSRCTGAAGRLRTRTRGARR